MSEDKELLELMEIAKNPIKDDEFKKLPMVQRFMLSDDVQPGDYKIPASLIYDRYLQWAERFKVKPLNIVQFFKDLALYADKKSTSSGMFYLLSPKGFDLSPQYLAMVNAKKRISRGTKKKTTKTKTEHQD